MPKKRRQAQPAAKGKSSAKKKSATNQKPGVGTQRLNKVLAAAGLGSRREVEQLIVQGRVEIDSDTVTDLACKVDPKEVTIKVDGQSVRRFRPVYFMLNKPKGVLSTNKDPSGRTRVIDLVPGSERVFSVGRLDRNSEGLTLLTNDGELAQKLAHPKYRIQKTYFVVVSGVMTKEELAKLRKGVYLAEGFARIDGATIRKQRKGCTEVEILLSEGKNREIRRILARAGHKVVVLRRIAIGTLRLGQLPVGASRSLTSGEVRALYATTDATAGKKPARKKSGTVGARTVNSQKRSSQFGGAPLADELPDIDDDFVGDFSGPTSLGSVLAYDEDPPSTKPRKSGHSKRQKATTGNRSNRAVKSGSTGTTSTRSASARTTSTRSTSARSTSARPTSTRSTSTRSTSARPTSTRSTSARPTSTRTNRKTSTTKSTRKSMPRNSASQKSNSKKPATGKKPTRRGAPKRTASAAKRAVRSPRKQTAPRSERSNPS